MMSSCVGKKKFLSLQKMYDDKQNELSKCYDEKGTIQHDLTKAQTKIEGLEAQLLDCKSLRDKQITQVGNLTVLNQEANQNVSKTLSQLENKDKYIQLLQAAKTKADSINLALAVNLKGVLQQGLDDQDVEIKVDKTVVMINLSDKMLYTTGRSDLTPRANEILGKIAKIIAQKPDVEVMVEGYTDNQPMKNACMADNWDLSVKRATSVVRALQNAHNVDPNRLIAAGRGQYNALASNLTEEGRAQNRRTRIIFMPKIGEFYDLLNPDKK